MYKVNVCSFTKFLNIRCRSSRSDLNFSIQEGKLNFSNSNIDWKNEVKINLNESELDIQNNNIVLNGKIQIDLNDTSEFYSFFQIKKNYRKN